MPHWADNTPLRCRHQHGFSLLELVIVIILVTILFVVTFDRLLPIRGDAEAAHVATVIGSLRSALGMEAASRVIGEGLSALPAMQGINPMGLLQDWPDTYIGEVDRTGATEIPPGSWYFHTGTQILAYRVRFPEYLEDSPEGPVDLRWRIVLQYDDISQSGDFDPALDRPRGLRLTPLDDYRWPNQPLGRLPTRG